MLIRSVIERLAKDENSLLKRVLKCNKNNVQMKVVYVSIPDLNSAILETSAINPSHSAFLKLHVHKYLHLIVC